MRFSLSFLTLGLALASLLASAANAADSSAVLRDSLLTNLMFMKNVYRSTYAPAGWKKEFAQWDLSTEIDKAMEAAKANPRLTVKDAQKIAKSFILSMKDYHVSIQFQSTEVATLPFMVKGTKDKEFIVYIDRTKLAPDSFPFNVGDELVTFGDLPAIKAVEAVQKEVGSNVERTDRALAELYLTARKGSKGFSVPRGTIVVGIKPKGSNQVKNVQLIWDYTPEKINDPFNRPSTVLTSAGSDEIDPKAAKPSHLLNPLMVANADLTDPNDNPYNLGGRKAFTPDLGTKIWESEDDSPFYAYIYRTAERKLIGYVRIPSYMPGNAIRAVAAFRQIITQFETATDAMVIDQVNNPGGSVFYLYALASMLSDQPLYAPQHRVTVTQAKVLEAYTELAKLEAVKSDDQAKAYFGSGLDGYTPSYEAAQLMANFLRFIIDEYNAGRTLTRPTWLEGADKINPAPVHYTKPILLLVNELDFSGGDFFPTILQDNKRATIMGTRTAGAGGYVNNVEYPNDLGIAAFRVTGSIAERINKNPIENLGVTPDVAYELTEKDLTSNYSEYTAAIRKTVEGLVK